MINDLRSKNKNGFTLIELLVAITIGVVVVGLGSVALNDFNDKQKIDSTRQEVLANLRLARNYAITNQLPDGGDRVAVTFTSSGVMTIQSRDAGDTGITNLFSKDVTPKGVGISIVPLILRFSVSDGRFFSWVNGAAVGSSAVVIVAGDIGSSKLINIDRSGLIYEK